MWANDWGGGLKWGSINWYFSNPSLKPWVELSAQNDKFILKKLETIALDNERAKMLKLGVLRRTITKRTVLKCGICVFAQFKWF